MLVDRKKKEKKKRYNKHVILIRLNERWLFNSSDSVWLGFLIPQDLVHSSLIGQLKIQTLM
jgi:hypothetical protein